jgi:vacuolar iron transporter family protein
MAASSVALNNMSPSPRSDEPSDLGDSYSRTPKNHSEMHSDAGEIIRDVIIGFADGLTVPFALTAGLSSYVARSSMPGCVSNYL